MTNRSTSSASLRTLKTSDGERLHYLPRKAEDLVVDMDATTTLKVESKLVKLGTQTSSASSGDMWTCRLSLEGRTATPFVFGYSSGIGLRAQVRDHDRYSTMNYPATAPVEPGVRDIVASLANDIGFALEMPREEEAAAEHVASELGIGAVSESLRMVRALARTQDGISGLIGRFRLEDFVKFGQEIEARPEPTAKTVILPTIKVDDRVYRAQVSIDMTVVHGNTRVDIDGVPIGDGAVKLSIAGSLASRSDVPGARWRSESSGQIVDRVREIWDDHPEVVELTDIWSRWHLNNMRGSSRRQTEHLVGLDPVPSGYVASLAALDAAGLATDRLANGTAYAYGSSWLFEKIPEEVLTRLEELKNAIPESAPSQAPALR